MDNLDKVEPVEEVKIGERLFQIKYTLRSVAQYKRLTGKSLLGGQMDPTDPDAIIALIWVGLLGAKDAFDGVVKDGQPDAKVKQHLDWLEKTLQLSDIGPISEAIKRAFEKASPVAKEGDSEKNGVGPS